MFRKTSSYPRSKAYRSSGGKPSAISGLSRRGLLGAVAVVCGAGILDLFRRSDSHATAGNSNSPHPTTGPGTTTNETATATPTRHYTKPPTQPPGHGDSPGAHNQGPHARNAADERVSLPAARVRVHSHPVYSVDELIYDAPKHAIALTIDDGPDPEWTPKVLRILDKHRMQASFCVVGMHAEAYPRLVRDVHRAGHVIVNHTYTHVQPFNHQTEKRIVTEITRAQHAIERATKVTPELFRAPGGAWNPFIFRAIAAYGLIPLDWDVDPMDWATPGTRKIERAMLRGRPGDIVLCHDGGGNRSETVRALRKVLPKWKHRGYVTIPLVVPAGQQPHTPITPATATHSPTATPSGSPSGSPSATASSSTGTPSSPTASPSS